MPRSILRSAFALVLALLGAPAGAQDALPAHAGVHVLTVGPGGELLCDEATEAQVAALDAAARRRGDAAPRLTPLPSLNAAGVSDFRIVLRATDQLLARPEALLAFRRSAARWERILQDPVTTVIDVDYGPTRFGGDPWPNNVLGSTNSALLFAGSTTGSADMRARLIDRASSDADRALYEAIPVPTPSTSAEGTLRRGIGGLIPLQVLGYQPAVIPVTEPFGDVPSIGFNSAFAYDFDPTDGVSAGQTDFEGVAIHEIGHALGFSSAIGISVSGQNPLFTPWDLFRVRPEAVEPGESYTDGAGWEVAERVVTPGPPNTEVLVVENGTTYYEAVQVFFDGAAEIETSTATGARQGGDGQQASHWRDDFLRPPSLGAERKIGIMDPNLGTGSRDEITEADIRLLDVIGYTVDYAPPTATVALSVAGQAIDDRFLVETPVDVGDAGTDGTYEVPIVIGNASESVPLAYALEVEVTDVFPEGAAPAVGFSVEGGTVAPGASETVQLRFDAAEQAVGAGRIRLRANDDDRAVIEVPFEFSAGGGRLPELVVGDVPASFGDLDRGARTSATVPLANAGTFDLEYRVLSAFVTRGFEFPATGRAAAPVFAADFESTNDLLDFDFDEFATPDRWQTRTTGPATLPGHSAPTVLYYGNAGGEDTYANGTLGQILSPRIDLSGAEPGRRVTLSFATYLQAQGGADVASVLISFDDGATFDELATSAAGGVLRNTDAWETVTLDVPGVAGFPDPVRFAFRFESDAAVTDQGWYLDDLVVDVSDEDAPFFVAPVAGTIPGDGAVDLVITADASALADGFYRGLVEIETDQPGEDPLPYAVDFSVGDPVFPGVVPAEAGPVSFEVPGGAAAHPVDLALRNAGDATLSYVRVLEPAASRLAGGAAALAPVARPERPAEAPALDPDEPVGAAPDARRADDPVLGAVAFGTTPRLYDAAQLADGRVAVVDGNATDVAVISVLPRALDDPGETFTLSGLNENVTGLAFNERTGTLWVAAFSSAELVEVTLAGGAATPTGRTAALDFTPFGMDYAPELDAFLVGGFNTSAVYAVTAEGALLPGYPVFVDGRDGEGATATPGVSFHAGVLEVSGGGAERLQRGQFGQGYDGATATVFSDAVLAGSTGIYAMLRDRLDPDGSFFVTTRPSSTVPARLVRVDPPDLPAGVGTRVFAGAPLFADRSVEPRAAFEAPLLLDVEGLEAGDVADEVAFLTNNPDAPLVRIPVTLRVRPVSAESAVEGAFALSAVRPNPARGASRLAVTLAAPAEVTAAVFDALGRRVAVLADATPLGAGTHDLDVPTAALAPGLYVVRVTAGDAVATRKVTVIR